jgi:hypothetical protein
MKNYVLVTAVRAVPGEKPVQAAGIKRLKRGTSIAQFICDFLPEACTIYNRGDEIRTTYTAVNGNGCAWSFTVFSKEELLTAVSHLTRDELLRDIGALL